MVHFIRHTVRCNLNLKPRYFSRSLMSFPPLNTVNAPAPGVEYFTPHQAVPAGSAVDPQPNGKPIPKLFQPIKIRGLEFHNRIFLSPLCQYSADNGSLTPWHVAHLGGIISRGPGLAVVEATSVVPEGRITPQDSGLWSDEQVAPLAHIVKFAHTQNQKVAIQLAHAGRKSSTVAPWLNADGLADEANGGWPNNVFGPSAVAFSSTYPQPKELTKEGIQAVVRAFVDAAKRAIRAGIDVIEIHGAHGYLLHSFVSPVSNKRTDEYGGSFEGRIRLSLEVIDAVRAVIPPTMPLFYRLSASDWLEESLPDIPSWRIEETVEFAKIIAQHGVDLIDVSSGGSHPQQHIKSGPAYQAHFSEAVKRALPADSKTLVGAVGSITDGHIAQGVLDKEQADVVFVGRSFQKNPGLVWSMAEDLGVEINLAHQISWGFKGRGGKRAIIAKSKI